MILPVRHKCHSIAGITLTLVTAMATPFFTQKAWCDEQVSKDGLGSANVWLDGLTDPSFRVRRESFLKLCDRSIEVDDWLAKETTSEDKNRSAIAWWLLRLRRSNGTPAERLTMLRDLDALRNSDESVIERLISEGLWDQLIELLGLLTPTTRKALLGEENRVEAIIERAWQSHNEAYVPKLLNLILPPTERVYVNRWWRTLGLPQEWSVDEQSNLPNVVVARLELDGKIDEAVQLASSGPLLNYVERILIRANRWDQWLALNENRIPISGSQNFGQQKAALLITLGRLDEAEALLEQPAKPRITPPKTRNGLPIADSPISANGNALLALALGRTTEFDEFLKSLPGPTAFMNLRLQGDVKRAFEFVGLEDLSLEAVSKWIENREFDKWLAGDLAGDLSDEETVKLKELAIVDIGDLFFQIGLSSQGKLIDDYLIQKTKELEGAHGVSAWAPLLRQWLLRNERKKAIHHWTEFLVRESRRTKPRSSTNAIRDQLTATNPFSDFFPEFPTAAEKIFETLLELAIKSEAEPAYSNNEEVTSRAISKAIEQLEDLHLGRLPSGWISNRMLMDLRQGILSKAKRKWESTTSLAFELAELFDSLGDTQMAIETLDLIPIGKSVAQAKARYLAKQGELDAACNLLGNEFQRNATDLGLLIDYTDNLNKAGRYSEMERNLVQGLSSVSNDRLDISDRSLFLLPVRREVQLLIEQLWWRNYDLDPRRLDAVRCLTLQFGEAANTDLSQASAAAKFARIDTIERVKFYWPNERNDFVRLQISYTRAFRSFILEAIANNNRVLADTLYRTVHRCTPQEIDMPIVVIPFAEKAFGKDFADRWFNLYYEPMLDHLKEFPNDLLIGNNTAWFAAKCNRNLETAWSLASKVVASDPTSTYLDTLAEIEYRLGRVERAIELSELCRGLEPRDKQHREQLKRFREGRP